MLPGGVFSTNYGSEMAIIRTRMQWVLFAAGIALLFSTPLLASSYWLTWMTRVGITIVAVLGLHILTGLCGQVSMGQAAFMGVGAYAVAILTTKAGVNGWLCLPISALSAGLVGLVFGLPCFRLKGFYLVISTMAASFIIIWCFKHLGSVTGGFVGMSLEPLKLGPIDLSNRSSFFCLTMGIVIIATVLAKNIQRTAPGRAFVAIRDNELAAEVNGIPVFRYKMLAFFIGCVFAGVAGWLWAYSQLRINPDQFRLIDSMWYLGMLVIGGWGSTTGVFFGVISLSLLGTVISDYIAPPLADAIPSLAEQIRVSMSLVVNGLVIIIFIMVERRGLYYRWQKLKAFYRLYPY
jgi:branched-chain amino acid transport system permease protein